MCVGETLDAYGEYREQLIAAKLLVPSGVRGVYGLAGALEEVIEHFERFVTAMGHGPNAMGGEPEVVRFPPIFNRAHYARINHIHNFPDLLGSVHAFTGGEAEHRAMAAKFTAGEDWTGALVPSELMLIPAACYPLYPAAAGVLPVGGRTVDLRSFVFRHEPSDDPARMQIFRQREYVRLGNADEALAHRDAWLERGEGMLRAVGLPVEAVVANDPFFGRGGRLAKATQREQALKFELVVPICSDQTPTAVSSCNYHLDYFGLAFDIATADGSPSHTSCIGFGLERIALALFKHHGLNPGNWPESVRRRLDLP